LVLFEGLGLLMLETQRLSPERAALFEVFDDNPHMLECRVAEALPHSEGAGYKRLGREIPACPRDRRMGS
jgi:hypothetical protein